MSRRPPTRRTGVVREFDDAAGYGSIADGAQASGDDAEDVWFFHCTAIADGSRSIQTGAGVSFVLVPGRSGRWEATDIRPA